MNYFKSSGMIIGFQESPNKYQKWYRQIDKIDRKIERKESLSEEEKKFLTKEYYQSSLDNTINILQDDFKDLFELVSFELGIILNLYFYDNLPYQANPNSWYIVGNVQKGRLYDYLDKTLLNTSNSNKSFLVGQLKKQELNVNHSA